MSTLINTKLPAFKAQAYHKNDFVTVTEKELAGKWSILFFYPADFTFVCPTELVDLNDKYAELQKMGVEVYSVSTDTHFTHKAWHDTSESIKQINYPMLADPNHQLASFFQVLITEGEDAGLALRGTFVIDPEGVIKTMEVHDNAIARDVTETVRKLKAAQYVASHPGEVCPAKWKEGEKTLAPSIDLVGKI